MEKPKRTEVAERFGLPDAPAVTDIDTEVINSGPAIFATKIYGTVSPMGMRLTFAEVNPSSETPSFRTAVFIGFHDVAALTDLLQRQLSLLQMVEVPMPAGDSGETK